MTPEQQALYYRKELLEADEKIKYLESKLADAEKKMETWNMDRQHWVKKCSELEAEAKAVRSKTIEEAANIADVASDPVETNESTKQSKHYVACMCGQNIAKAIRALNSGKE